MKTAIVDGSFEFCYRRHQRNEVMPGGGVLGQGSFFFPLKITVIMEYVYANRKDPMKRKFWCTTEERGDNCRGKSSSWQKGCDIMIQREVLPISMFPPGKKADCGRLPPWEHGKVGTGEPSLKWSCVLSETGSKGIHQRKVRKSWRFEESETNRKMKKECQELVSPLWGSDLWFATIFSQSVACLHPFKRVSHWTTVFSFDELRFALSFSAPSFWCQVEELLA